MREKDVGGGVTQVCSFLQGYSGLWLLASLVGCGFASNPIDMEENTESHLAAAKHWPQDDIFPHMQLIPNPHPMTDADVDRPAHSCP